MVLFGLSSFAYDEYSLESYRIGSRYHAFYKYWLITWQVHPDMSMKSA